jgi:hypothetical protein
MPTVRPTPVILLIVRAESGKPSLFTKLWGGALRIFYLGQRKPLLYSFQQALPRIAKTLIPIILLPLP